MQRLTTFSPDFLTLTPIVPEEQPTVYRLFPSPRHFPEPLEPTLRKLGFGYRANFIEHSLGALKDTFGIDGIEAGLRSWRKRSSLDIMEDLIRLKGVGRKVADCVMLMSLDQPSLIPVDTHVSSIAARHPSFPNRLRNKAMTKQIYDEVQLFLLDKWGPLGGWCQAVAFAADLKPSVNSELTFAGLDRPQLEQLSTRQSQNVLCEEDCKRAGTTTQLSASNKTHIVARCRVGLPAVLGFKRTRSVSAAETEPSIVPEHEYMKKRRL
jgi:hypothetical protein